MYEAARKYSELYAYPNKIFPVTEKNSRCVLCQQILEQEAVDRLNNFENFIRQEFAKKEEEMRKIFENIKNKFESNNFESYSIDPNLIDEIKGINPELAETIEDYKESVKIRAKSIKQAIKKCELYDLQPLSMSPIQKLLSFMIELSDEVTKLKEIFKPEKKEKFEKEFK